MKAFIARHRTLVELVRWGVFSVLSLGLSVGVTALFHQGFHTSEELAYAISRVAVFVVNFILLRQGFVYGPRSANMYRQFTGFLVSTLAFRGLEYAGFLLLNTWLGVQYILAIILVQGGLSVAKFFYYRAWIFGRKNRQDPGEQSSKEEALAF